MALLSINTTILEHLTTIWRAIIPLTPKLEVYNDESKWEVSLFFWPEKTEDYYFRGQIGSQELIVVHSFSYLGVLRHSENWDVWNNFLGGIANQLQVWGWTKDKPERISHLRLKIDSWVRKSWNERRHTVVSFPDRPGMKKAILEYPILKMGFGDQGSGYFISHFVPRGFHSVSVFHHDPDLNAMLDAISTFAEKLAAESPGF